MFDYEFVIYCIYFEKSVRFSRMSFVVREFLVFFGVYGSKFLCLVNFCLIICVIMFDFVIVWLLSLIIGSVSDGILVVKLRGFAS